MATITATKITESGVDDTNTVTAANAGDNFVNTGVEFIRIQNFDTATNYTVRVVAQTTSVKNVTYGSLTKDHQDKSVAANGRSGTEDAPDKVCYIGPFKQGAFNDVNNKVQLFYSTGTSYDSSNAIGGSAKLKVQVLYLDNS